MKPLNPEIIKAQIGLLRCHFSDDEEGFLLSLESETNAIELLSQLVDRFQEAKSNCAALTIRIRELQEREERFAGRQKAIKDLMFRLMEIAELTRLPLPLATLTIAKGTPSVRIIDEKALPPAYVRTIREPAKVLIADSLKAGHAVPGAELSNGEPHIVIRVK
jgi:hypothetical protein